MISRWIDGLDDLAGIDILMAREERRSDARDIMPPAHDRPAWPTLLWHRLRALTRHGLTERAVGDEEERRRGESRRP